VKAFPLACAVFCCAAFMVGCGIPAARGGVGSAAGGSGGAGSGATGVAAEPAAHAVPALQLVESFPVETSLDHPDLPQADDVWVEMIAGAQETLDFAEFYASDSAQSRLGPVVAAVEAAAARGVRVRFLAEKKFHRTYPEILDRLAQRAGIEVRLFDAGASLGGVLHAKYFVVDGEEVYLGSQNFDWRALMHIVELGVRLREPTLSRAFREVFAYDWRLAGAASGTSEVATGSAPAGAVAVADSFPLPIVAGDELRDTLWVTPVFSPRDWLPAGARWDLPELVEMIDGARTTVRVQLLTYRATGREGESFDTLESALRRAAERGVSVELLLSDWCKRAGTIEGLQSLEPLPGIAIRLVTIPPWSGGFIPYARVIHAKYLVVDGREAWIGTSNWEWDYFYASRNVGVRVQGRALAERLDRFFLDLWDGPYAAPVDPHARYTPPRIGE
jgi:phosphatidylserine/phosphatidylglycerophosphate/cardiolipin synthase-like enzyme